MNELLERFLPRIEFDSYEDFKENFQIDIPEHFNFGFDVVDAWAEIDPQKPALVWCDDHGHEKRLSFGDVKRFSNRIANFFLDIGIQKGDAVMLILRRRWEYWICATALHKIGAVLIPGTLQLTKKDLLYRAEAATITTLICVDDAYVIGQVEEAMAETETIKRRILVAGKRDGWLNFDEALETYGDEFPRPAVPNDNDDMFLIYFTSGTTGMPKMACHNYTYPLGHIITAKYWQHVEDGKLHISVSDSGWAKFSWGKIYGQWICGAVNFVYDMDKFVPANLLAMIEKYQVTTFCAPPTMYRFMLQEKVETYDLSSVKMWCTAGEPLNPEVFNKWEELTGRYITEGFGQSETVVILANFEWFAPKPGSMGKPSPLYDIALLDSDGNVCEDGDEGEIVIRNFEVNRPPGLFTGYHNGDEATNACLEGGEYNLKDVAWRDSDGYYWFIGRHDDVIKCSGYRIGPFEVESALLEHASVVECGVTAAPDPIRGQVVKATIVLAEGYAPSPDLTKELQDHVKNVTAPYKYPRIIEYVEELPKTISGKIKRAQIRRHDEEHASS